MNGNEHANFGAAIRPFEFSGTFVTVSNVARFIRGETIAPHARAPRLRMKGTPASMLAFSRSQFANVLRKSLQALLLVAFAWLFAMPASAQSVDVSSMSPEELSKLEVTTASRREQSLANTAAAVFVITQEDIRRSTAT